MKVLNLPEYNCVIQKSDGKLTIFDPIRKKHIVLTPEEWVRQNFLNYLIEHLNYPRSLIRVESGLSYNRLAKRSDILIHDRKGKALMLVECKAYDINIGQDTFEQAAMYNHTLSARYIVLTNGMEHWCCEIVENGLKFMEAIPRYEEL